MHNPYFNSSISPASHEILYDHDMLEWHNPNPDSYMAMAYRTRVDLILQTISKYCKQGLVLDLGCAQGNLSLLLAEQGYEVVAIDLRHEYLTYMMLKYERGKLAPVAASLDGLPFKRKQFDVILFGEVIEH